MNDAQLTQPPPSSPKPTNSKPADAGRIAPQALRRGPGFWPRRRHVVTALVIVALGLAGHRENFSYQLVGFDAYMQVIAARILSFQDFLDTFTEKLTDGRIEASFYRPVQNLSIALDYALWGLKPWGYQLTTMFWFTVGILLMYATVRRLLGPGAWVGPAVAALFFALHPVLLNVLPSPARRSDMLVIDALLALLYILPISSTRGTWPRILATGALVTIAAGAKDIGVMGLGLVFIHQLFFRFKDGLGASIWRAWLLSMPAAIGAGLYLMNRTVVLQGFGGYVSNEPQASYLGKLTEFGSGALVDLLCPLVFWPTSWMPAGWHRLQVAIASGCLLVVLGVLCMLVALVVRQSVLRRAGIVACLGLAWMVPPTVLLGVMNWYGPWYTAIPMAGLAMLLGALAEATWALLRGRWYAKIAGLAPAVVLPVIMLLPLWYSPLRVHYTEWQRASAHLKRTLDSLDTQMARAHLGSTVLVKPVPNYVDPNPPPDRPHLSWVATIMVKGIQAYAEMKYPQLHPRAIYSYSDYSPMKAKKNEVLILVHYKAAPMH